MYYKKPSTLLRLAAFVFFAVQCLSSLAQTVAPSLVTAKVDDSFLVSLKGNTPNYVRQQAIDVGPADPGKRADRLMLIIGRSSDQDLALQDYLRTVQDRSSTEYHKFLTPAEFGQRFGISDSDLRAVKDWLRGHGLEVNQVNAGRTAIEFSGTLGQVQEAFHTQIHNYVVGGVPHWANTSDPSIPATLKAVVSGVARLDDFKPHSQIAHGLKGKWDPKQRRAIPNLTGVISGTQYLFVTPG